MKKLLLILLLSASIVSCNKEGSPITENAQGEKQSLTRGGYTDIIKGNNYILSNTSNKANNATAPARNAGMEWVWNDWIPNYPSKKVAWTIQYLDNGSLRFWAQNIGFLERDRVMAINWRRPNADKSANVVMKEPINTDSDQQWQLLGHRNYIPGEVDFWQGVIINRYNGQMLELADFKQYKHAVVRKPYAGSEEKEYYDAHGNFTKYPKQHTSSTIWYIYKQRAFND